MMVMILMFTRTIDYNNDGDNDDDDDNCCYTWSDLYDDSLSPCYVMSYHM